MLSIRQNIINSMHPSSPNLKTALGLRATSRVAFVGAGGKTTAIFRIAREFTSPVIVTATSHLELFQTKWADHHFLIDGSSDTPNDPNHEITGVTLFTGPKSERSVSGLEDDPLRNICSLADKKCIPLLIEADGSRRHPLKAPAVHEPPIPNFVDTVVVVAGLSALGKPCSSEWIHRPEIYTQLSGLQQGEPISLESITTVLKHPLGGLKNIPPGTRKIVLLNQADTPELCIKASIMEADLRQSFDCVIITALHHKTINPSTTGVYMTDVS